MFTLKDIQEKHSKVKTSADFPGYVQALIRLGVTGYDTFVHDRQVTYFGKNKFSLHEEGKYPSLDIARKGDIERLSHSLKLHHDGQINYMTFCENLAKSGIEKWALDTKKMTRTYYDTQGTTVIVEKIPEN